MKKRILASVLALCMMVSMSITASAVEGDTAIPEAVPVVDVTATEEAAETDGITVSNGITVTTTDTTQTLGVGTWYCDGIEFTASSVVMDDITISYQASGWLSLNWWLNGLYV